MSVSRGTMVECTSEEAADEFEAVYWEICRKILPEADALILVRTDATSGRSIIIYNTEELAEEMLLTRAKMLEQCPSSIQEMFHLERPVGLHYLNDLLLENKAT